MERDSTMRQSVKYTFYKLDEIFLRLPEEKQRQAKLDFIDTVRTFNRRMLLRSYTLVGLRADVDFLLWEVAEEVEAFQELETAIRSTALGPYLRVTRSFLSGTRRSIYDISLPEDQGQPREEERIRIEPSDSRYLFVYPFIKTRAWYMLSQEERQEMITEHIRVGRKYPDIRLNTTYSYGIDDQEFVVAFEGDNPHDFIDLVAELRHTQASLYTQADTPMHICIAMPLPEMMDSIGGAKVSDLVQQDVTEVGGWLPVAQVEEVPAEGALLVYYGTQQVALFHTNGQFYALNNRCPHARGPLCEGTLHTNGQGPTVRCPWHEAYFSLETGEVLEGPSPRDVETFQVRVEDDTVYIARAEQPEPAL
ncbi:MAG: nitrite reductase small subunit NirD [Chloroflexi bacterium]|nr:nitrite reductase small subunit NirD [Chloroflexota bacterium]